MNNDKPSTEQILGTLITITPENEQNPLTSLAIIAENIKLIVCGSTIATTAAIAICFAIPPTYTARTQFLPPIQNQSATANMLTALSGLGGLSGLANVAGIKNPTDQYVSFLKSTSVQNALIDRFDLKKKFDKKTYLDARRLLSRATRLSAGKDGLVVIDVDANSPDLAAHLANAHIEELNNLLNRLSITEAQQRRHFFEQQLTATRRNLEKAEEVLRATGVSSATIKSNPVTAVSQVAALKAQITAQEVKIGSMRGFLSDSAPEFKQALVDLSALRAQLLASEAGSRSDGNISQGNYFTHYREFKYYETLYEIFSRQYEVARLDEAREGRNIQVIDIATPPERKSSPKTTIVAILVFAISLVILSTLTLLKGAIRTNNEDPEKRKNIARIKNALWPSHRQANTPAKTN